jgi:23S rRNA (guanosine2251-2'-O)-methyltransferase
MIPSCIHPVEEAVAARPREIERVMFDQDRRDHRRPAQGCRERGVLIRQGPRRALDQLSGPGHQGVVARLAVRGYLEEEDALEGAAGKRFLFLLDEVQDPHNLGAVLRVAEALGAGVAVPERGSAPLSEAVGRTSAGAVERVRIHRVKNMRRFVDRLKNEGFRVIGLEAREGARSLYEVGSHRRPGTGPRGRGKGHPEAGSEGCDELASADGGKVASLNVSTAASAAGCEAVRQRLVEAEKGLIQWFAAGRLRDSRRWGILYWCVL